METLSNKIYGGCYSEIDRIAVKDVKEFIKDLKKDISIWTTKEYFEKIEGIIDKRAGDVLVGVNEQ